MELNRDTRKNIYRWRKEIGIVDWSFREWNEWFKRQTEEQQIEIYEAYLSQLDDEVEEVEEEAGDMIDTKSVTPEKVIKNVQQAILNDWISFGCVKAAPTPRVSVVKQEEKGTTMDTRTEAQQAKDYLINSLRSERQVKIDSEYEGFNLNFKGPKTLKELRDGLKAGFVALPKNEESWDDDTRVYSWYDYVAWQDPNKVPDKKGFETAKNLIEKDVSEVQDTIVVFGAEKGLEKLNEFKAKTYH